VTLTQCPYRFRRPAVSSYVFGDWHLLIEFEKRSSSASACHRAIRKRHTCASCTVLHANPSSFRRRKICSLARRVIVIIIRARAVPKPFFNPEAELKQCAP
jgi:hypothetical protein